jgi:hypothetical protein
VPYSGGATAIEYDEQKSIDETELTDQDPLDVPAIANCDVQLNVIVVSTTMTSWLLEIFFADNVNISPFPR